MISLDIQRFVSDCIPILKQSFLIYWKALHPIQQNLTSIKNINKNHIYFNIYYCFRCFKLFFTSNDVISPVFCSHPIILMIIPKIRMNGFKGSLTNCCLNNLKVLLFKRTCMKNNMKEISYCVGFLAIKIRTRLLMDDIRIFNF